MSVGRNEPCPCGSGRKYKVCHGSTPANPPAVLLQQALAGLERGDTAQAEDCCRRILASHPEMAEARHYLGMALCFAGRTGEGIAHLRASLTLRPSHPVQHNFAVFHNNLALWLEKTGDLDDAEAHFRHAMAAEPNYRQARFNLARLLMRRKKDFLARILLDELLLAEPQNPDFRAHSAEVHFALKNYSAMEKEYRELIANARRPVPLRLNLADHLRDIGRLDEARAEFEAVLAIAPGDPEAVAGIAQIEETRNRLAESERWIETGLAGHPQDALLRLGMARLRRRQGRHPEALEWLDGTATENLSAENASLIARERGMILDKQKRWNDAFDAFTQANALQREDLENRVGGTFYDKNQHSATITTLKEFFTPERVSTLISFAPPAPRPAPVFIVGFPRSGTTLLEQMLGTHPNIHAGDEIQGIPLLKGHAAMQLTGGWKPYPDCLGDVTNPGNGDLLEKLRNYYLRISEEQGATAADKPRFTDKMPLNEESLGLIRLILPESPIIHVVRHPLDVILSCYFNQLSHGDNCSLTLDTLAFHYQGIWELVEHYLAAIPDLRYTRVRYEDLLADPEREMRRVFEFLGEAWEPRCLEFHKAERVARTASYAQVNQPLYRTSQERWRAYRKHLEPIIPELRALIDKLGYSVD